MPFDVLMFYQGYNIRKTASKSYNTCTPNIKIETQQV